jgi:hypothetical protein
MNGEDIRHGEPEDTRCTQENFKTPKAKNMR